MADEPQKSAEQVAAAIAVPEPEKETNPDKPIAVAEAENQEAHLEKPEPEAEAEKEAGDDGEKKPEEVEKPLLEEAGETTQITQSVSFKEETNVVGDLPEAQKKALDELKQLIQDALNKHQLSSPPPPKEVEEKKEEVVAATEEEKEKKDEAVVAEQEKEEEKTEETKIEEKPETAEESSKEAELVEVVEKEETTLEVVAEPEVVEKASVEATVTTTAVEEDGTKAVEAVEEAVISSVAIEEPPSISTKEGEGEATVVVEEEKVEEEPALAIPPEEVEIWGIPLLADERSDVILLKFLRARDFKVKDAFTMIKNTVRWRKEFGIEALLEEDFGSDWDKVVFSHGYDKEGHPVCYNVFGEFENKELYQNTFSDEEKRHKFIRWRIQFLEKSVRKLDFSPSGISTMVQVNDLKNSPGLGKRELRQATNQALHSLQDNYPELVAKQVFINVPWWYLAFSRMISAFLTQRTKSKFVFAGPSKSAETLFKYIVPEQVPIQYGGLSREGEQEFSTADPVTEATIKPATKHTVEFPFSEKGHLVWEVRVVGWDVNYGAEFVPSAEDGYTVIVQKSRKIAATDETVISNSFKIGEPGKVVLTIDNQTSKKKKLLYRSKTNPFSE